MLYELYVENFAIISKMRLNLTCGLNALSGETGAGKSLVVDAVALLIGGRANDAFIRGGYDRCLIEGVFTAPFNEDLLSKLAENGFNPAQEDDNLVLTRELVRGGRGICRINGRTVTLSQLRELGRLLINIHGQMEHMLLLEEDKQLQLLDSYGGTDLLTQKEQVARLFEVLRQKQRFFQDYEENKEKRRARMELLQEQVAELSEAKLIVDEEQTLRQESQRLNNGQKLIGLTNEAYRYLMESSGAVEALAAAAALLRQTAQVDNLAQSLSERVDSLYYEVEDAAHELAVYQGAISTDAYRLDEVEARLALLGRLKKKFNRDIPGLLAYLQQARKELDELDELDFSGAKARREVEEASAAYEQGAQILSKYRAGVAQKLSAAITKELHLLCMSAASFRVELVPNPPNLWGREKALFMIQTNAGEDFYAVAKIASGGELSRIVLAMKVILSQLDAVPTLVFDEVDSGLGGRALNAVAQRLAYVGQSTQAIVVTHAPVMAAAASHQLHVGKQLIEGRTEISIRPLNYQERIDEISRMIAGDNFTETTRRQAEELLRFAQQPYQAQAQPE